MSGDPFGDLQEWGQVLAVLDALERAGELDEVQPGLIRLTRCRSNWQVRERALRAARRVERPTSELLAALLAVVNDCETYPDARILAAAAVAELTPRAPVPAGGEGVDPDHVPELLEEQLETPEAPVVQQALADAAQKIRQALQVPA